MSRASRPLPLFRPSGIDARATSDSPFELIVGVGVAEDGWKNFPGAVGLGNCFASTYSVIGAASVSVAGRVLGLAIGESASGVAAVVTVDEAGGISELPLPYNLVPYGKNERSEWASVASLNGLAFIGLWPGSLSCMVQSGLAKNLWAGQNNMLAPNAHDAVCDRVVWRQGSSAPAYTYVTGRFGGRLVCAHRHSLFIAGFDQGQIVELDGLTPDDQAFIPSWVIPGAKDRLRLTPQMFAYTDPDDPFTIAYVNFRALDSKYPITGMASLGDKLIVLTRGEVWVMVGSNEEEWVLHKIADGIGCSDHRSIAVTPDGVFFGSETGIYFTDGSRAERVSDAVDHLFEAGPPGQPAFSAANIPFQLTHCYGPAFYWASRGEVWFPMRAIGIDDFRHAAVYNVRQQAWTIAVPPPLAGFAGEVVSDYGSGFMQVGEHVYSVRTAGALSRRLFRHHGHVSRLAGDGGIGGLVYCFLTKPLAVALADESFVVGVDALWRKVPDGMASVSGTSLNTAAVLGEEYDFDGQAQVSSSTYEGYLNVAGVRENVPGVAKWGTGKWNRRGTRHIHVPLDVRSNSVRLNLYGYSTNGLHLRGLTVHRRTVSPPGGRK